MKPFRRIILIQLIVILFLTVNSFAQDVAFGGKLGVNFSQQSGDTEYYDNVGFDHRYHFEGFVNFKLSKHISLQLEAGYSQKGYMYKKTISNIEVTHEGRFDYINAPLSVRYTYGKKFRLYAFAGVYAGMLLNSEIETQEGTSTPVINDVNEQYKGFDFGILAGTGVGFRTGKNYYLYFEGKYEHGLSAIDDYASIENAKNQTIATSIGIIYYY